MIHWLSQPNGLPNWLIGISWLVANYLGQQAARKQGEDGE